MTSKKEPSAEFYAEIEGDADPMAVSPRHFARQPDASAAATSIRRVVLEALLGAGYDADLANRIADQMAKSLPSLQQELTT